MSTGASKRKIVVLGMMTKMPVAGVVWQTVHYLVGLERLGYEAWYVEAHARTPSMLMEQQDDNGSVLAAAFIDRVLRRFDLGGRWAYHALHHDGTCYGMSRGELERLYRSAALIINLHGGTQPLPEHYRTGRLVYLETDPVQLQIELHEGVQETIDFLEPHVAFFTFGENYGRPDCLLPVSDRFRFHPTRQPVVLDFWAHPGLRHRDVFTTIGNWQQSWRSIEYRGESYSWSKHDQFERFLGLPRHSGARMELALSSYQDEDRARLEDHGWAVRPALEISADVDSYRKYIAASKAEFTVAKDQNVRLRSGWFSDRSATYLAAGRPVVTQDTGFGDILPTGAGLFAVTTVDDAATALEEVEGHYDRHSSAASDVANACFASDIVLSRLLDQIGLGRPRRQAETNPATAEPLPAGLVLTPQRRRPIALPPETVEAVIRRPVPRLRPRARPGASVRATAVVVSFDNLPFTRMCLESLLADPDRAVDEIVVVDNGSSDGTVEYLTSLAAQVPIVRVLFNQTNRGFAPGVNQGLAVATGGRLLVLNNDTIVPPGALGRLLAHLDDASVGVVGPVTNAAGNGARVLTTYRTHEEMVRFARRRAASHRGRRRELDVLHMFCVALRQPLLDEVGMLDERFEVGLFEDDDFSRRVRRAGLGVVCADDVFVHHFGEATLGSLVPGGGYTDLFARNRSRFEEKWGVTWGSATDGRDPDYDELVRRVRKAVCDNVPRDAGVAVVSRGDPDLLSLGERHAWHFPQGENGGFAGHYPSDSADALAMLERLHRDGATHVVFPATALWWLEHYPGLRQRLTGQDGQAVHADDSCLIFELEES
jgi:GT2 family glycosyltransferase